ncbi:MAG: DUF4339 domain-containing protein [Planctomycetota bacterium]
MPDWYVRIGDDDEADGPYRSAELLGMVREGRVTRETQVRKDDSAWFQAEAVGGLFEAAVKPTLLYSCPFCDVRIPEPPCHCPQCGVKLHAAPHEVVENRIKSPGELSEASSSRLRWLNKLRGR